MNVHLGVNSRFLRQAGDDRAQAAVAKPEDRDGAILDFDGRMVQVGPVAADLGHVVVHQPLKQVEHVGRLVDENAAAFGIPAAAPGIGLVVGRVAPAIHRERAQDRPADLAGVDRVFHAPHGLVPSPLADHAELGLVAASGREHGVAIGEARGQRLFDERVRAGLGSRDGRRGVQRMRRRDAEDVDIGFPRASGSRRRTARHLKRVAKDRGALEVDVADGDEFRLGQAGQGLGVDLADLAAAHESGSHPVHRLASIRKVRRGHAPAGRPATRPSRPCRSCHPRC